MKIYGVMTSPFVRMCMVTAHECGLGSKVEHVTERVVPAEANTKLTGLSGIGKIPVLETDHHHPVYDSRVIIEYLAHVAGNKTLIPDDGVKRFRVLTLQALAQGLADVAVALRHETSSRPQELQWSEWINNTKQRMNTALDDIENNWTADLAEVTSGTIAVAVVLSYINLRFSSMDWRKGRPKLAAFHKTFSTRDSMVKTALPVS
jgi:glutathione S-transferase